MIIKGALKFACCCSIAAALFASENASAQPQYYPMKGTPLVNKYENVVISRPPASLNFDAFYKKYIDACGIPVVSSEKVSDAALLMARDIINYMLAKRPDVRTQMMKDKAMLSIMAYTEMQTDLPEYRDWKKPAKDDIRLIPSERENYDKPGGIASMTDKEYWNKRARGMGGIQTSCAEENLLGFPGTKYFGENIMIHEWSHNIMEALRTCDPELISRVEKAYENAKKKDMYKNQYAINTIDEYWAEGTQWWFWSNFEFNDGKTRLQGPDDLKAYDPVLYEILSEVYIGHHIPADIYYGKNIKKNF
ncbi:glycoside hydrolase [Desertivirga arenae]|uniref:glycoside hydrolase n=1 Tax=Desertivirga arenae TaxID=2810309 RepID=UPI001A97BE09|nr:glycoside hydrolase [Pedobacter sp. SYSU D00823]